MHAWAVCADSEKQTQAYRKQSESFKQFETLIVSVAALQEVVHQSTPVILQYKISGFWFTARYPASASIDFRKPDFHCPLTSVGSTSTFIEHKPAQSRVF